MWIRSPFILNWSKEKLLFIFYSTTVTLEPNVLAFFVLYFLSSVSSVVFSQHSWQCIVCVWKRKITTTNSQLMKIYYIWFLYTWFHPPNHLTISNQFFPSSHNFLLNFLRCRLRSQILIHFFRTHIHTHFCSPTKLVVIRCGACTSLKVNF